LTADEPGSGSGLAGILERRLDASAELEPALEVALALLQGEHVTEQLDRLGEATARVLRVEHARITLGEAPAELGERTVPLEVGGRLPTNTHGGQLSEAYIHGMNGVNEGVRLIRGTSTNQPEKNDHVLVTAGVGVPTSGMVLGQA